MKEALELNRPIDSSSKTPHSVLNSLFSKNSSFVIAPLFRAACQLTRRHLWCIGTESTAGVPCP
jgi:hypothetical protein